MVTREQARKLIADKVARNVDVLPPDDEIMVVDEATIEKPWGWVFFYTSRKWHETQLHRYAIAGNAPLIVEKESGNVLTTGTAFPVEHYISIYERCGNPNGVELPEVQINGWRVGALTISAIQIIRQHSELGLGDAKQIVEACMESQSPTVVVSDTQKARSLVTALHSVGFEAEVRYAG